MQGKLRKLKPSDPKKPPPKDEDDAAGGNTNSGAG